MADPVQVHLSLSLVVSEEREVKEWREEEEVVVVVELVLSYSSIVHEVTEMEVQLDAERNLPEV